MTNDKFHGWAAIGKGLPLQWTELLLKEFDEDTVEMDISHCGICGSDIHTMDSAWHLIEYPTITGHEIAGTATRVGNNVKHVKVGDRIGVGAQSSACLNCKNCNNGEENLCQKGCVLTFNGKYPNGDKAHGGFADKWRGHQRFAFKIPDSMTNEVAATLFCAGASTYAPLKRYNITSESKVGIIGIGGLGHYALQWSKAIGATTVALSRSDTKRNDAEALACDQYINTSDPEQLKPHMGTFTHLLSTHVSDDFNWALYFSLLDTNSYFILVDIPRDPLNGLYADLLSRRQITLAGSCMASPKMIEDMLEFAAKHDIKPWIQKYPMEKCNEAVQAFRNGKSRYRIVLEN